MRIIAGKFKGRKLRPPSAGVYRPTTDRVREAMFSTLEAFVDLEGAFCADLYAGCGSLGLEALSRGADGVVFVDSAKPLEMAIKDTLEEYGELEAAAVCRAKVKAVLQSWQGKGIKKPKSCAGRTFDVVFADPPYNRHPGEILIHWLLSSGVVRDGTVLVLESSKHAAPDKDIVQGEASLSAVLQKDKTYGDTSVRYYRFESREF